MDGREVDKILSSFRIIVDTREQATPKARRRYRSFGCPTERATLSFGDYCGNVDINGEALWNTSRTVIPACCIERKMSLDELAMCFTRNRERFEREFQRATDAGARIYLLVEDGSYEDIIKHRYRSKFASNAFIASLIAWTIRYNLTPIFCQSDTSGRLIKEILFRDMRKRIEAGEYGKIHENQK